jgi:hypothetical protein
VGHSSDGIYARYAGIIDGETDLRDGLAKVAALPERRALRIGAR